MRRSLLALLVVLAACSDRYGAYFVVDGNSQIAFDRLEFYFGENVGANVPIPPGHALTEPEAGLLLRRLVADSDIVNVATQSASFTYFVPPDGDNAKLGDYVLVIAYAGTERVGIGELFDFDVPAGDVVFKYDIPLVAYAAETIELWGRPTQDCVRWKRDRGGAHPNLVAMTRGNDVDCDDFLDRDDPAADCEPLRYCDGSGNADCIGRSACVTADDGCRIGTCQNKDGQLASCTPTTCVVDAVCSVCDLDASPRELLDCALLGNGTHEDYPVKLKPSQALCTEPYKVYLVLPTGVTCDNPRVEAAVNWMPGAVFNYQISGAGSACLLTLTPPSPGAVFEGVPHIMVSMDSSTGSTSRRTIIFGLSTTVDACTGEQTVVIDPTTVGCLP